MDKTCKTCIYFAKAVNAEFTNVYDCRFYPPKIFIDADRLVSLFPTTHAHLFCGKHKAVYVDPKNTNENKKKALYLKYKDQKLDRHQNLMNFEQFTKKVNEDASFEEELFYL